MKGTAVVMQGRYIEHQALKALGGREPNSMVCSLRPKSALMGISYVPELYYLYASYRLQALEERMKEQQRKIRMKHDSRRDFDVDGARMFLMEQKEYIEAMLAELVEVR